MRKLLVFQHVPFEILGTLDPILKAAKFRVRYINFGRNPDKVPSIEGYDGLVVLGGPMNVYQHEQYPHLKVEIDLIRQAIEADIPILGICLGAQLLSVALGGEVSTNPVKEIGWYDVTPTQDGLNDPLIGYLPGTKKIFQWHGDTYSLPKGAIPLASSPACKNQAFRYGKKAYGFQFHLEVDKALIERWLTTPVHIVEMGEENPPICPNDIRKETDLLIDEAHDLSDQVFKAFIKLFGEKRNQVTLGSR